MVRFLVATASFFLASQDAFAGIQIPAPVPVPEPISLSLLAVGVGGAILYRKFRK